MDLQSIRQKLVFDEADDSQGQSHAPAPAKLKGEEAVKKESTAVAVASPELLAAIVIDLENDEQEENGATEPAAWQCQMIYMFRSFCSFACHV